MGRFEGKVALITGAGRGQGRAHAVGFAREGAHIVAVDVPKPMAIAHYPMASSDDLNTTADLVQSAGGQILAIQGDVRDRTTMTHAVDMAHERFGGVDIIVPNAAVCSIAKTWEIGEDEWRDLYNTNVTGVLNTVAAAIPRMIEAGRGGSIVMISSIAGVIGLRGIGHYAATKHAVIGLMKSLANDLGPHRIRVNAVCPSHVHTPMVENEPSFALFRPDLAHPTFDDVRDGLASFHVLPEAWMEPSAITDAVLFLASDAAQNITGVTLPVDLGATSKVPGS